MTTRYVGAGGNNANDGLSWANRKLTLTGAEDTPVVAGDTVYVGPGVYRETLTVDVSGTAGNPITYIGDYTGANTDGVGGVVRVTGSDDDITPGTRGNCVGANNKNYRTFQNIAFMMGSDSVSCEGTGTNWIMTNCFFQGTGNSMQFYDSYQNHTVQNCLFYGRPTNGAMTFFKSTTGDNSGCLVQNCIFIGSAAAAVRITRVGGITVKNCTFTNVTQAIRVVTALSGGQTTTVNNNIFQYTTGAALQATATSEITEDYNSFFGNSSDRNTVNTGANSNVRPALLDLRWFFEAATKSGTVLSFFDQASYSTLVELNSGASASTTDLRNSAVVGTYREWGALEYNSALVIASSAGGGLLRHPGMAGGVNG